MSNGERTMSRKVYAPGSPTPTNYDWHDKADLVDGFDKLFCAYFALVIGVVPGAFAGVVTQSAFVGLAVGALAALCAFVGLVERVGQSDLENGMRLERIERLKPTPTDEMLKQYRQWLAEAKQARMERPDGELDYLISDLQHIIDGLECYRRSR